jgi:hypothetical protein
MCQLDDLLDTSPEHDEQARAELARAAAEHVHVPGQPPLEGPKCVRCVINQGITDLRGALDAG